MPVLAGIPEPGMARPLLIAHSAGNTREAAAEAASLGADLVEVDLWVHRGRFEARHERRLPLRIPLLYEAWYVRLPFRDPVTLPELLEICAGSCGVFLDIKSGGEEAALLVEEDLARAQLSVPVAASSQYWPTLRHVANRAHQVAPFYSIDVPAKLDLFLSLMRRDALPVGVSCRHELLDRSVVQRCHEEGVAVVAWTVDDPARASELVAMGVDAITTHAVTELRAALGIGA